VETTIMKPTFIAAGMLALLGTAAAGAPQTFHSSAGTISVTTVASHLAHPWSLAFLPDGRMLVTERPGRMRILDKNGRASPPLAGVPKVFVRSQAGLMDVILARDFAQSRRIYFCYAQPVRGGAQIAVARATLDAGAEPRLTAVTRIYEQKGPPDTGLNIGCRMVEASDGNLFVSLGDHYSAKADAQTLGNTIGKLIRITPDGKAPPDNPFVGRAGALPEIWAYGLRNAEGLAVNPETGALWEQEHGPMGGDEINIIEKGGNYGWPVVSFGVNYDGSPVGAGRRHHPGMVDPVWHWTPSIAPSGMAFYTGDLIPAWKGSLFSGALKFQYLSRLQMKDGRPSSEERLLRDLHWRIRDVRQGPDGALYLLTDETDGRVLRLAPAR
jgi:glucose/arabinose dehydrogenase